MFVAFVRTWKIKSDKYNLARVTTISFAPSLFRCDKTYSMLYLYEPLAENFAAYIGIFYTFCGTRQLRTGFHDLSF